MDIPLRRDLQNGVNKSQIFVRILSWGMHSDNVACNLMYNFNIFNKKKRRFMDYFLHYRTKTETNLHKTAD